ncbi:MAG: hypothetical protein QF521_19470 [Alphaproteobacteria bacterium]|jgi:hypothetical protein|nr:hypothetical protein [Alphaproteobacteria bacterium]
MDLVDPTLIALDTFVEISAAPINTQMQTAVFVPGCFFPQTTRQDEKRCNNKKGADPDNANEVLLWSACGRAD